MIGQETEHSGCVCSNWPLLSHLGLCIVVYRAQFNNLDLEIVNGGGWPTMASDGASPVPASFFAAASSPLTKAKRSARRRAAWSASCIACTSPRHVKASARCGKPPKFGRLAVCSRHSHPPRARWLALPGLPTTRAAPARLIHRLIFWDPGYLAAASAWLVLPLLQGAHIPFPNRP
jgi:hypothetical protein